VILTEHKVGDGETEDEDAVDGKRNEKQIKIAIVTTADAVADPRTVVVKPL